MPTLNRSRVLCVDDDQDACEILSLLLNSYEIDATCVQSAVDAWPLIKGRTFDLFLLDGWLPEMDGFEFCRRIRELDSETPILFYSGAAYDADKQKGIAAGANAYVAKPDFELLLDTIRGLIGTAKAKSQDWVLNQAEPQRTPSLLKSSVSQLSAFDAEADGGPRQAFSAGMS
ncbi:MAG TPA: response regulator [Pyrinomonadaceae bacterium]|nr:response regulator [Pyrinomonadaceae bacterium]